MGISTKDEGDSGVKCLIIYYLLLIMEICIDFDGTCVTHEFPKVGKDIGAVPVLKKLVEAGHKLILFTMRSNRHVPNETGDPTIMDVTGMFLDDAVNWFKQNDIPLYGINENPTQKTWTNSPKSIRTIIY